MKLKQIFAAALLFCTAGAWAQTDVTSTYIVNPGFESCTPATGNQAAGKTTTGIDYTDDGWVFDYDHAAETWSMSAVLSYSRDAQINGATIPAADNAGNTGNALGVSVGWGHSFFYRSKDAVTLPAGHYELTVNAYNALSGVNQFKSINGFVPTSGASYLSTKTSFTYGIWETDVITFDLTEATVGKFQVGGTAISGGSGSNAKVFFDNLTLVYTDPLKAAKDALQAEIDKAKLCDAKEGLAGAISTAEGVLASATTQEELATALTNLQAADKDAVLRYENGLADATYAAPVVTSFVVNGTFDSGISPWQRTGTYQNNKTANNQSGAFTGNFYENWNGSAQANKMYQTISNIPNGTYRLDIAAFVNTLLEVLNASQFVFANNDKTYLTTGEPTAYEVYTVVTNNQIEIGLEQTTATANWMGLDNVSLRYYGAGDVINDAKNAAHKLAWQEAKDAAEAAVADDAYANVTGSELTALQTEIGKAEPTTADGYDEAAAALTTATSTFTAAKADYDAFVAAKTAETPELSYAAAAKKTALTEAKAATANTATEAATATTAIATALRAYYESHAMAEGVATAVNLTSKLTNPTNPSNTAGWTLNNTTGDSKMRTMSSEPYTNADGTTATGYFDSNSWGAAFAATFTQNVELEAGKYILSAKARGNGTTTYQVTANGEATDIVSIGNTGGVFGRGWNDYTVEFTLAAKTTVALGINMETGSNSNWLSFGDFRLVRLELYTEMAKEADYQAMEAALATAKTKTLGFADEEYAPYNNVEAIKAITAAEAIDKNVENAKADVTDLITALGNWTANDGDVDAIYDGQFKTTAANATSGDINLPGWTKVDGIRLLVKDEAIDPGLAHTDGNAAVFAWGGTTLTYGNQVGYTLPLNKYELYELTLKVTGWRDGDFANVFTVALDGDSKTVNPNVPGKINDAGGNPFASLKFYLTPTEDNSTLTIYANRHFAIADLSLKPAVAEDITIDEDADYTPAETYADVTLARTIKADTWNTFVVPFDITNEELEAAFGNDVAVAEFSENSDDANAVTVNFDPMTTPAITANKPVLLKGNAGTSFTFNGKLIKTGDAKVAGTNVDFIGTYNASTTVKAGDYFISANKLYKSSGETTIKGTRAYIDAKNDADVKLFIDGIETGISEINGTAVENGAIYNLAGQRVSNAQKGIYIVNGKKVIIK